jgi:hypothetical protein
LRVNSRHVIFAVVLIVVIAMSAYIFGVPLYNYFLQAIGSNQIKPTPITKSGISNVTIDYWPGNVQANPSTNLVYVAGASGNVLTVVNGSTFDVIKTITLRTTPDDMAVNPKTNMVYVSTGSSIIEMDGKTNSLVGVINVSVGPLAVDPSTNMIYGISQGSDLNSSNLLVINGSNEMQVANVSLPAMSTFITIDPKSNTIFTAGCQQCALTEAIDGFILTINVSNFHISSFPIPNLDLTSIAVNSATNTIYGVTIDGGIGNFYDSLVAINGNTGSIITKTRLDTSHDYNHNVIFNAGRNEIYIEGTGDPGQGTLWTISGSSYAILKENNIQGSPMDLGFNPNLQEIYLTINPTDYASYGFLIGLQTN